jgi:hypothetical protein
MSRIGTQQTHGGETCAVFLQSAISAGAAGMAELILARANMDWANSCYSPTGRPSIVAVLRNGTADCRRHRRFYTCTTRRFALQRPYQGTRTAAKTAGRNIESVMAACPNAPVMHVGGLFSKSHPARIGPFWGQDGLIRYRSADKRAIGTVCNLKKGSTP